MAYLQPAVLSGAIEDAHLRMAADPILPAGHALIVRIEGTLLREGHAIEGAGAFVRAAEERLMLVSNSSRDTGRTMAGKLRRAGIDVPAERIVLAGEEAVRLVASRYPGARCLVAASRVLSHALRDFGLVPVQRDADVVLLGRDSSWTYQRLALIANEVARGAVTVAINPRGASRCEDGRIVPEAGALAASIEAATGKPIDHIVAASGAAMVEVALARLGGRDDGGAPAEAIYIGAYDPGRPMGLNIAGLRTIRVAPGVLGVPTLDSLAAQLPPPQRRSAAARRH